jgi:SEC-C motif
VSPAPVRWWDGRRGAERLARDKAIVAAEQPELRWVERDDRLKLEGDFAVRLASGFRERISVEILFPDDYPNHEPAAFEPRGRFQPHDVTRHFFTDSGRCCLWLDVASLWQAGDREALRTFLDQLAVWFHRQLVYDANPAAGWPGSEYAHTAEAYFQYFLEDWGLSEEALVRLGPGFIGRIGSKDRCPCGSGAQYRRCHQPQIDRFRGRAVPGLCDGLAIFLVKLGRLARENPAMLGGVRPGPNK